MTLETFEAARRQRIEEANGLGLIEKGSAEEETLAVEEPTIEEASGLGLLEEGLAEKKPLAEEETTQPSTENDDPATSNPRVSTTESLTGKNRKGRTPLSPTRHNR